MREKPLAMGKMLSCHGRVYSGCGGKRAWPTPRAVAQEVLGEADGTTQGDGGQESDVRENRVFRLRNAVGGHVKGVRVHAVFP